MKALGLGVSLLLSWALMGGAAWAARPAAQPAVDWDAIYQGARAVESAARCGVGVRETPQNAELLRAARALNQAAAAARKLPELAAERQRLYAALEPTEDERRFMQRMNEGVAIGLAKGATQAVIQQRQRMRQWEQGRGQSRERVLARERIGEIERELAAIAAAEAQPPLAAYEVAVTSYAVAVGAEVVNMPRDDGRLARFVEIEARASILNACPTFSADNASTAGLTREIFDAMASRMAPEIQRRLDEGRGPGRGSAALSQSLGGALASPILRANAKTGPLLAQAETTLASLRSREAATREAANRAAQAKASAEAARAEAASRQRALAMGPDADSLSRALAQSYYSANQGAGVLKAAGLYLVEANQVKLDLTLTSLTYTWEARNPRCSKTAPGAFTCGYEMRVGVRGELLGAGMGTYAPWAARNDRLTLGPRGWSSPGIDRHMASVVEAQARATPAPSGTGYEDMIKNSNCAAMHAAAQISYGAGTNISGPGC